MVSRPVIGWPPSNLLSGMEGGFFARTMRTSFRINQALGEIHRTFDGCPSNIIPIRRLDHNPFDFVSKMLKTRLETNSFDDVLSDFSHNIEHVQLEKR